MYSNQFNVLLGKWFLSTSPYCKKEGVSIVWPYIRDLVLKMGLCGSFNSCPETLPSYKIQSHFQSEQKIMCSSNLVFTYNYESFILAWALLSMVPSEDHHNPPENTDLLASALPHRGLIRENTQKLHDQNKPLPEMIKDVTYSSDVQQRTPGCVLPSCNATNQYLCVTLHLALQPLILPKMSSRIIEEWKHKAVFLGIKRRVNPVVNAYFLSR